MGKTTKNLEEEKVLYGIMWRTINRVEFRTNWSEMDFQGVGKILILSGASLASLGLLLFFWQRIPFLGKLPGDIFAN